MRLSFLLCRGRESLLVPRGTILGSLERNEATEKAIAVLLRISNQLNIELCEGTTGACGTGR